MKILKSAKTKLGNEIKLISTNLSTVQPFNHSTALVIGVFHGDEPQGKFLIEEYLRKQGANPHLGGCYARSYVDISDAHPPLGGGSKSLISGWGYHKYPKGSTVYAKELRNNPTLHEKILWKYLRKSQLLNLKFRRQQPIGPYIVDFMCCNPKIIIELDGGQHNYDKNIEYDKQRDEFLSKEGYKVIRIWNTDISKNIQGVLTYLENEIMNPTPKSEISTLPQGEGGDHANILFIPCLNPDGMVLNRRTNANGVDLNRNFPTKNWGEDGSEAGLFQFNSQSFAPSPQPSPSRGEGVCHDNLSNYQSFNCGLSPQPSPQGREGVCHDSHSTSQPVNLSTGEPPLPSPPPQGGREHASASATNPYFGGESAGSEIETQFVMEVINEYKPEKILTLHAPYKVVNYDGPAKDWAESVSKIINYPVEESIGYPTPGSFGTYAGVERNIPVITLELDEEIPPEQLIPPVFEIFDNL